MSEIANKVRSLGVSRHKGQKKVTQVLDDRNGRSAGKQVEHWDDHVDAVVTPAPIAISIEAHEEG